MLISIIVISIIVLIAFNIIILLFINSKVKTDNNISEIFPISIIIAAKNEQRNVKKLINCLKELNYPKEKYEVMIVDDNSDDETFLELVNETKNFNNIFVKELKAKGLAGKRDALTEGIVCSHFPYILITDADCQPDKNWLKEYSKKFSEGYDMLFGIAPFYRDNSFVNNIACFENLRSTMLSFAFSKAGLSYTASARNFGFTKEAFEKLGGYKNTKNTLSGDDDLLLREAVKSKMKIGVVAEKGSFVYSESKKTFKEYFQQRARHTQTSFHYLKRPQLILGLWHLMNLFFLFSPLLIFVNLWLGILLPVKLITDIILLKANDKKFGYRFSVIEIIYLQIVYELFLVVHFFNARFTKIKWK